MRTLPFVVLGLSLLACSKDKPAPAAAPETTTNGAALTTGPIAAGAHAAIGQPAPDFTLKDLDGKEVKLSSFKGKIVVLEWFNPGCPFVNNAHLKGTLKDEATVQASKNGVVWLAINSGGAGKQGNGLEANREGVKKFGLANPVLLDEGGEVGHAYGATNTPHMFVIDKAGVLQYQGAVDNSPDGERESAPDNKVVAYVDDAVAAISAGRPLAVTETKAYGCGVKYAK